MKRSLVFITHLAVIGLEMASLFAHYLAITTTGNISTHFFYLIERGLLPSQAQMLRTVVLESIRTKGSKR